MDVGGVVVRVMAAPSHRSVVEDRLGTVRATGRADVELAVEFDRPDKPETEADQRAEGFDYWHRDGVDWIADGRATVRLEGTSVRLGGAIDSPQDRKSVGTLLQFGLAASIADRNRVLVHGAAVGRNGRAAVIVGGSGQGKSTLAIAAHIAGWDLLGDDLAVVSPLERRIQAVARGPMVPPELAAQFDLEGDREPGPRGRIRRPATVLTTGSHVLVGLIVVEHGDRGALEPLKQPGLLAFDEALAVPPFQHVLRRHLAPAAALVDLPTVCIRHDRDPKRRVAQAQNNLQRAFDYFDVDQ